MAKKFSISQNPTFKEKVKVPRIGGDPLEVEFEYKYLGRKQLAALYEEWQEDVKSLNVSEESTLSELTDAEMKLQVKQLKDVLVGWNFDEPFTEENIEALVESSVHASEAVISAYQSAYAKAKVGN